MCIVNIVVSYGRCHAWQQFGLGQNRLLAKHEKSIRFFLQWLCYYSLT